MKLKMYVIVFQTSKNCIKYNFSKEFWLPLTSSNVKQNIFKKSKTLRNNNKCGLAVDT